MSWKLLVAAIAVLALAARGTGVTPPDAPEEAGEKVAAVYTFVDGRVGVSVLTRERCLDLQDALAAGYAVRVRPSEGVEFAINAVQCGSRLLRGPCDGAGAEFAEARAK